MRAELPPSLFSFFPPAQGGKLRLWCGPHRALFPPVFACFRGFLLSWVLCVASLADPTPYPPYPLPRCDQHPGLFISTRGGDPTAAAAMRGLPHAVSGADTTDPDTTD